MTLLDVTEILSDPDFSTTFTVIQTYETISASGRSVQSIVTTPDVVGVVIPEGGNLVRLPDGSRLAGSIDVYTTWPLKEGTGGADASPASEETSEADIVVWRARKYVVRATQDYSEFGQGWVLASADFLGVNK